MTDHAPTAYDAPIHLRRELLAEGSSDREVAHLVRSGALHRLRRGAYVEGGVWEAADLDQRHLLVARAVARQAQTRLVLSHVSALPLYGAPTWGLSLDDVHVTRPDGRSGRKERGVRQHRGTVLDADLTSRHGLEVTSATKTALDVTTCAGVEPSLVVINYFLRGGFTTLFDLEQRYAGMTRDPFTLKTDLVLRLAEPRLESVGECRTWYMLYRAGVPAPVPQYAVRDDEGNVVARLDFAWPELGVWLEFDGRTKYSGHLREGETALEAVLREKERESRIMELTGWRCIRITWSDLDHPAETIARILRLLGVAPRVPSFT